MLGLIVGGVILLLAQAVAAVPPRPHHDLVPGRVTGLPVPRFVSLRADPVNLRVGPGRRYPVQWVLQRRSLPLQVVKEFRDWRGVRLPDGTAGWVHSSTLTGRRTLVVEAGPAQVLRSQASRHARPVAYVKAQVVGRIVSCTAGAAWCCVQVAGYQGFLPRHAFWGTFEGEEVAG